MLEGLAGENPKPRSSQNHLENDVSSRFPKTPITCTFRVKIVSNGGSENLNRFAGVGTG
jgi:hypothetical protein